MANRIDPDQTPHLGRLIWVYTVYSDLSVRTVSANKVLKNTPKIRKSNSIWEDDGVIKSIIRVCIVCSSLSFQILGFWKRNIVAFLWFVACVCLGLLALSICVIVRLSSQNIPI